MPMGDFAVAKAICGKPGRPSHTHVGSQPAGMYADRYVHRLAGQAAKPAVGIVADYGFLRRFHHLQHLLAGAAGLAPHRP